MVVSADVREEGVPGLDRPGALDDVVHLEALAEHVRSGSNVLQVRHARSAPEGSTLVQHHYTDIPSKSMLGLLVNETRSVGSDPDSGSDQDPDQDPDPYK